MLVLAALVAGMITGGGPRDSSDGVVSILDSPLAEVLDGGCRPGPRGRSSPEVAPGATGAAQLPLGKADRGSG